MRNRFSALVLAFCAVLVSGCAHSGAQASASASASPRPAIGNRSSGANVFRANCAVCHTANGAAAGVGPSLEHEKQRKTYEQTVAWIESPDPPMPKLYPAPLSEKDVADVAAYVQSL
jgi:mono/diheme cytochrome c family protein